MAKLEYKNKTKAQYRKEYWALNSNYHKNYRINNKFRYIITRLKAKCKKLDLEFNLDIEYLKNIYPKNNICPVLNIEFIDTIGNKSRKFNTLSIDRIDPNKGYIKGNVMFMSELANRMKTNANKEQLHNFAKWVIKEFG